MITAEEARNISKAKFEADLEADKIYFFDKIDRYISSVASNGGVVYKEEITYWHSTVLDYIKQRLNYLGYYLEEQKVNDSAYRTYLVIHWEKERF